MNPIRTFKDSVRYYSLGLYNSLDDDHCFLFASGIAYNVILCIIPLSLILFQAFSIFLQNDETARTIVIGYLQQSFPVGGYDKVITEWVQHQLVSVADLAFIPSVIALLVLLWLSSALFSSLRTSLNAIFHMKSTKHMAVLKLYDIGMIVLLTFFLLISFLVLPLFGALRQLGNKYLPYELSEFLGSTLAYVVPLSFIAFVFLILFKIIPNEKLPWRVAFVSTLVTVGLLEVSRVLFAWYLSSISSIGALYGAYAFLVAIALWAFYGSLVFLIGAEVGKLYNERIKEKKEPVLFT